MADRTVRVRLEALIGGFQSAMQAAGRSVTGFGTTTQQGTRKAGAAMRGMGPIALGAGIAVAAGLSRAVSASREFEDAAIKLQTQIGLTAGQADALADASRRIGAETGRGAQEAVEASFFIASAGLRGADAMDALERSAQAARIGLGETKDVADLVTSAMNAYGSETLNAEQATDILVGAVREGKAEAPALAGALGQILPIASEMGVSFDEVSAAVAGMTRTGTDAGTAAMQLRQILSGFLNPAEGVADAMAEIGLSAEGLRATIREDGLWAALTDLRDAAGDNEAIMGRLFPNVRSLAGFLDLTGANADETARIFDRLADSAGNLDEAIDIQAGTTSDKLSRIGAALRDDFLEAGDKAKGPLDRLADGFLRLREITDGWDFGEKWAAGAGAPTQWEATAESVRDAVAAVEGYNLTTETGIGYAAGMLGVQIDLEDALADVGGAAVEAANDIGGYLEALARIEDPVLRLRDAVENVAEAEREYKLALEGSEDASMSSSEASWNLYEAISALQQAALDGELSFEEFTARLDHFESQGWISKDMADFLRGSVDELRGSSDQYRDGGPYGAEFYADTAQAKRNLESLRRLLASMPKSHVIDVSMRHGAGIAQGGVAAFHHSGGMVGDRTGRSMPFLPLGPLRSDEVPIIAQDGERVLSRSENAAYEQMIGHSSMASLGPFAGTSASTDNSRHVTIEQTINGAVAEDTMRAARHQARMQSIEMAY